MRRSFSSAISLLIIAVWAACEGIPAGAAETDVFVLQETSYRSILRMETPVVRELNIITRRDPYGLSESEINRLAARRHDHAPADRSVHNAEIIELVFQEFDLFAGLRNTFADVEHRMDGYLERMKLKGGINLSMRDAEVLEVKENVKLDGGFIVRLKEALGRKGLVRSMLPDHINWSINSDLSGRYVIGELEIGHYLFMEGSIGEEADCRMIFEMNF